VFLFLVIRPPPTSTLFPYTTLFRSARHFNRRLAHRENAVVDAPATFVEAESKRALARISDVDRCDPRKRTGDLSVVGNALAYPQLHQRARSTLRPRIGVMMSGSGAFACMPDRRVIVFCRRRWHLRVHRIEGQRLELNGLADGR